MTQTSFTDDNAGRGEAESDHSDVVPRSNVHRAVGIQTAARRDIQVQADSHRKVLVSTERKITKICLLF
jgi:hypothetical protein